MVVNIFIDCESAFMAKARYVFSTLFSLVGLPYRFSTLLDQAQESGLSLAYAKKPLPGTPTILVDSAQAQPSPLSIDRSGEYTSIKPDIIANTFFLLTDLQESEVAIVEPLVNRYAWALFDLLVDRGRLHGPILQVWPWPDAKQHAVALSHDVDQTEIYNPVNSLLVLKRSYRSRELRGMIRGFYYLANVIKGRLFFPGPDPAWNFERLMDLEREVGFRSTLYFVSQATSGGRDPAYEVDSPRIRSLIHQLVQGGWEIGVHGSYHSSTDATQLASERVKLEQITGKPVTGIRQHYLRFSYPETFKAQSEAGYRYDSSIGYTRHVGFRAGLASPFHPFDPAQDGPLPLVELPLTVMDGALFWHLEDSPALAIKRTQALLEKSRAVHGFSAFLWHQRTGDEKRYPGWWNTYRAIVHEITNDPTVWLAPACQIVEWWNSREKLSVSYGFDGENSCWHIDSETRIDRLVIDILLMPNQNIIVNGIRANIQEIDINKVRIHFPSIPSGHHFKIVVGKNCNKSLIDS